VTCGPFPTLSPPLLDNGRKFRQSDEFFSGSEDRSDKYTPSRSSSSHRLGSNNVGSKCSRDLDSLIVPDISNKAETFYSSYYSYTSRGRPTVSTDEYKRQLIRSLQLCPRWDISKEILQSQKCYGGTWYPYLLVTDPVTVWTEVQDDLMKVRFVYDIMVDP